MKIAKNTLGHVEHELREDLNTVGVDLMSAINEIILRDIGELLSEALAIEILFLIARGMSIETVWYDDSTEAVVFAIGDTWLILLSAFVEAEIVLFIDKLAEGLV
jgi:hypothetical protein